MLSVDSKRTVFTKIFAVSVTTTVSVERKRKRLSLAPKPQTQNDGKSSLKVKSLQGRSPSGKRYQKNVQKLH